MSSGVTVIANKLADELSKWDIQSIGQALEIWPEIKIECQEIKFKLLKDKIADKELKLQTKYQRSRKLARKVDLAFFTPFRPRKNIKIAQKEDVMHSRIYIQPQTIII